MGATGAVGAQGAQGDTGPGGVTCYEVNIFVARNEPEMCDGNQQGEMLWRQNVSFCDETAGCYYTNETNCLNSTPDYSAVIYVCNPGPFPPVYGILDANGCNTGSSTACDPSDMRFKQGIETLKDSLEKIMKINAVEYDWNSKLNEYEYLKEQDKLHTIGLIAQEVKEYFPEVVSINPDGYYWIDYTKLNAVLVEAIKEQQLFIEEIDKELEFIESKLI
jgi:hypothetical protein